MLKTGATLFVILLYLLLVVFVATGVIFLSSIVAVKDLLILIVILALYGIYSILYVLSAHWI